MIFAGAASVRSSLAARLDMSIPGCSIAEVDIPTIRRELLLRYCNTGYRFMDAGYRGHKKASRDTPARRSRILLGTGSGHASSYDAGIRTVSTTWITPFDWLTFGIVTVEEPPLASTIVTVPPDFLTVSSSPSTVLSFLPSVRLEASSRPGTT